MVGSTIKPVESIASHAHLVPYGCTAGRITNLRRQLVKFIQVKLYIHVGHVTHLTIQNHNTFTFYPTTKKVVGIIVIINMITHTPPLTSKHILYRTYT